MGFPGGSDGEKSACNAKDLGLIPVSERSLEKEMTTHSGILSREIPGTEEALQVTVHGVTKSLT